MEESREEGELSGSDFEEVVEYNPILRPDASLYRNVQASKLSEDESSETEDSDSDCPLPKRKKAHYVDMRPQLNNHFNEDHSIKSRKKNNIWSNVLQEEGLMQDIGGVGLKKIDSDRNVESYDYTQALKLHGKYVESDHEEDEDFEVEDKKDQDKSGDILERITFPSNFERKRKRDRHKKEKPRYLKEIQPDPEWTDDHLGNILADALFESKSDLLVRCVEVLGRKKALEIYNETAKVEKDGGIMVLNGSRRRTSGGVYLHLLKTLEGIAKEDLDKIFVNEFKESQQMRRKKRAHRKIRKQSKDSDAANGMDDDGFHIRGLFSDDPGGTKCPGSTPVASPQDSGSEGEGKKLSGGFQSPPLPLKEVFERAEREVEERDSRGGAPLRLLPEEMDVV